MRVMLIQPPFSMLNIESKGAQPPLGLAYIAAVIEKEHTVEIIDAPAEGFEHEEQETKDIFRYGLGFEHIAARIASFNPDVVGVSCIFSDQSKNV